MAGIKDDTFNKSEENEAKVSLKNLENKCQNPSKLDDNLTKQVAIILEGKKKNVCEICDYNCSRKSDLKRHVEAVHQKIKPFKCEICGYCSCKRSILKRHIEAVHEGKNQVARLRS